jgi:hypothetical protein
LPDFGRSPAHCFLAGLYADQGKFSREIAGGEERPARRLEEQAQKRVDLKAIM